MWFTFVTARLFHSLSIQPRLAATLLSSCSVANSPTRRVGLSPTLRPASLAQAPFPPVQPSCRFQNDVFAKLQFTEILPNDPARVLASGGPASAAHVAAGTQ